jgi:hypothetical protein
MRQALALLALCVVVTPASAEWRVENIAAPGRVTAIEGAGAEARIAVGSQWHRLSRDNLELEMAPAPARPAVPAGALPDGKVAVGHGLRAWLAEPTDRYGHGVLGDAIEAAALVIERRDGPQMTLRLGSDAVFEDLAPRLAVLEGRACIVVVKSYLDRGAALALVDAGTAAILAETPPIGRPNAWLNPAGIADFDRNGTTDIALVRQPHVVGRLELWSWSKGRLTKTAELPDVSNHAIGSRAIGLSGTADFDGDGRPDLVIPSLDRRALRLIAFTPTPRDLARLSLPARIVTNLAVIGVGGRPAVLAGLENGQLVLIRR